MTSENRDKCIMHNMINFNGLTTNEVMARLQYWRGAGDMKLQSPYVTSAKVRVDTWSTCVGLENSLL